MTLRPPVPNLQMAERFLKPLDPRGIYTFQTFDDSEAKRPALSRVLHGTFEQHKVELSRLNAAGAGIFVMVNEGDGVVHEGYKTCRTRASVVAVRALFVDLDGAPLDPVLRSLPPDIIVESSAGRWHAYWLVRDVPLKDFELRQKQIAAKFGGDTKVCDLPRVMRVPGFFHQKHEPSFMSRLVRPE